MFTYRHLAHSQIYSLAFRFGPSLVIGREGLTSDWPRTVFIIPFRLRLFAHLGVCKNQVADDVIGKDGNLIFETYVQAKVLTSEQGISNLTSL